MVGLSDLDLGLLEDVACILELVCLTWLRELCSGAGVCTKRCSQCIQCIQCRYCIQALHYMVCVHSTNVYIVYNVHYANKVCNVYHVTGRLHRPYAKGNLCIRKVVVS